MAESVKKDAFLLKLNNLKPEEYIKINNYEFGTLTVPTTNNSTNKKYTISSSKIPTILFNSYKELLEWISEKDDLRICTECNMAMTEGWVYEEAYEHYCSKECYTADANRTWGEGNWRITKEENEEGGFLEFLDENDGQWEPLKFYWTSWAEYV